MTDILEHLTDEYLIENRDWGLSKGIRGPVVTAEYLLPVPAQDRYAFVSCAHTVVNRTPGYRWSDGLYLASTIYARGGVEALNARVESDR